MQNFCQESGRAGRDGRYAESILFYRFADIFKLTSMNSSNGLKNIYDVVDYSIGGHRCRRHLLESHFGDAINEGGHYCEQCDSERLGGSSLDITEHCLQLFKIIDEAAKSNVALTGKQLIDVWYRGVAPNFSMKPPAKPILDRPLAEQLVAFLLIRNYLKEVFRRTKYTTHSYIRKGDRCPSRDAPIIFDGRPLPYELPKMTFDFWNDDEALVESVD